MQRLKRALLFSGGLDSTCAAILDPTTKLIRVSTGSRYDVIEAEHADAVAQALGREVLHVDGVLDLSSYEAADALIPARNALIALCAAQHAESFALVSVAGDGTHATDKDAEFAYVMTLLLRKLFGRGEVVIPYRSVSKIALLCAARDANRQTLLAALGYVYSCYMGAETHCGRCKACVRLWGALRAARLLDYGPTFEQSPSELPFDALRDVYAGRGEEQRIVLSDARV